LFPDAAAGEVETLSPTYGWALSGVKVYVSVRV
jgi:hypothetical protein